MNWRPAMLAFGLFVVGLTVPAAAAGDWHGLLGARWSKHLCLQSHRRFSAKSWPSRENFLRHQAKKCRVYRRGSERPHLVHRSIFRIPIWPSQKPSCVTTHFDSQKYTTTALGPTCRSSIRALSLVTTWSDKYNSNWPKSNDSRRDFRLKDKDGVSDEDFYGK